jgi:hypothetical protein
MTIFVFLLPILEIGYKISHGFNRYLTIDFSILKQVYNLTAYFSYRPYNRQL